MKKTIINLFLINLLLFTVCSCQKKIEQQEIDEISFSFYSADIDETVTFDDLIAQEITKRTGVKLEFMNPNIPSSQFVSLMIASRTYPDLIYAKSDITKLISENAILPLDDYIKKYGANIKKLYGDQIVRLRYTLDDPSIYTVGTYEIKTKVAETAGTMQIQNAVLKEFYYPELHTLEDYENLLIAYKNKYPEINGHKTIGFSIFVDDWFWYLTLANPGNYVLGYPDDGQWIVDQTSMETIYKFLHPQMFQYYKWLNKIYNNGLLDPDSFTQSKDMWESKLKDGYVLGTTFAHWGLQDIQKSLVENNMENRSFAYLPITVSPKYKDPSLKDYGFSGGWGIAISADCKDPIRAFKFLDWMCSEEAQILTNWGLDGIHYFYDGMGRRVALKNSLSENDGVGKWRYPFPQGGSGYIDSTGNPLSKYTKENIIKNYNSQELETLKAYGAELWTDLFPSSQELGVSKHGQVWQYPLEPELSNIVSQADDYVKKTLIKMIIGPEEDFEKSWLEMQTQLSKIGMEKIGEKITELIKMKMELWQ